ncbi:MAG: DUF1273 family protein [Clostridia bacterium]|nr:DUF1273 family protein [Clostridia bacterium]
MKIAVQEGIKEVLFPKKIQSCAFTGHRELGADFSPIRLMNAVDECLARGARVFYNGVARGFDLLAAECVLNRKKLYGDIKLVACVPYLRQADAFKDEDKCRYDRILKESDEVVVIQEEYTRWCMAKRNDYMAQKADVLIAYCTKETGGSAYTVKKFRKKGGYILFV